MSCCLFQDLKLLFFRECSFFHRHNYNTLLHILNYNYVRSVKGLFQDERDPSLVLRLTGGINNFFIYTSVFRLYDIESDVRYSFVDI